MSPSRVWLSTLSQQAISQGSRPHAQPAIPRPPEGMLKPASPNRPKVLGLAFPQLLLGPTAHWIQLS